MDMAEECWSWTMMRTPGTSCLSSWNVQATTSIAPVTGCTDQLVGLSIETHVPHMKQHISVPLSQIQVSEDPSHYTRDPERPLQRQRLMLVIDEKRPPVIY